MAEPLYLKYRPKTLSELVGQEIIAKTLTNAISLNRIAHAYFFTGPRGCGKTSSARILAKSLNCKQGPTLNPCGVCINCREITDGISPDVIEIDAASHRSVEDAAQVIERCHLASQTAPYKIYIFDEVHMLSKEAFNALLKTIEEPPPKVIFILATTEEHKVPPTIVSRCQKFSFRPIDINPLVERLKHIAKIENIKLSEASYFKIAKQSKGGLRDALSLLDQVSILAVPDQLIEDKLILDLFGSLSEEALDELLNAICVKDSVKALEITNKFLQEGVEPLQLLRNLLEHAIEQLEKNISKILIEVIEHLSQGEYSVRSSSQAALRLKSLILGTASFKTNLNHNFDLSPIIQRLEFLENKLKENSSIEPKLLSEEFKAKAQTIEFKPQVTEQKPEIIETQIEHPKPQISGLLEILLNELPHIPTKTLIRDSKAFIISQTTNSAIIGIPSKGFYDKLNESKKITLIQETLSKRLNTNFTVRFELNNSFKTPTITDKKALASTQADNKDMTLNKIETKNELVENIPTFNGAIDEEDQENIMKIATHILGARPINN